MDFHPIASMFPLMEGPEYDALVADIAEHGQQEPIAIYEGMILDGRNRWRACERLGLMPLTQEWEGDDPEAYVISLNLHRRHLTKDQQVAIMQEKRAQGWTLQKIADTVGVGVGTVHRAIGSDFPIGKSEIENSRGQMRPTHYQPRQVTESELLHGPAGDYRILGNGVKQCEKCGQLWAVDLPYCPYCNVSQEARVWHAEQERKVAHVAYNSGNNEWYTPPEYIRAAREVMGGIDLDPASSEIANRTVEATEYYAVSDDGLAWDWYGRVWMNPPYASNLIGEFCNKLAMHVKLGHVTEACVLVNNATETGWFNALLDVAACVCFIRGRVKFIDAQGNPSGAPLQGQAVLYIGPNAEGFGEVFSAFGTVLYAW